MPDDVSQYITLDPTKLAEALQAAQADAYAGGSLAALQVLPDGADPGPAAYFGPDPKQAWDSWNPGNVDAANLLDNGGFQSLLDQSDITIKGITSSTMDRMATILADGAVAGDSIDAIAGRLYDYLGDSGRAFTIANTEIARATEAASLDRYQANGVTQWEWVLSDDACPECQDMYDNNPHSLEEDQPPLHPNCRCTTAPIVPEVMPPEVEEQPPEEAPTTPELFPDLPKMSTMSYDEAVAGTNPLFSTSEDAFRNNCSYCAPTMEMRARGYDVTARQTFQNFGRVDYSIAKDWIDPATGESRPWQRLRYKDADGHIVKAVDVTVDQWKGLLGDGTADWPPGSRGFIKTQWKQGGGHIFNIYKDDAGEIHLVDGQVADANVERYLRHFGGDLGIMRVDDLEPVVDRLLRLVTDKPVPTTPARQKTAAKNLLTTIKEDLATHPPGTDDLFLRTLQKQIQAALKG